MAKNNNDEIDFNNPDSFKKIVNEISKEKLSGSNIKDIPKNVIAFLTGNMKSVAIIAIYFLGTGLVMNIIWIIKLFEKHFFGTIIMIVSVTIIILIKKYWIKILEWFIKLYYSIKLKVRLLWQKLKK